MAHGCILTIFNYDPPVDFSTVKVILDNLAVPFLNKESTFFIQTLGSGQFQTIIADLRAANLTFTCLYVHDPTGSAFRTNHISQPELDNLNDILCMP